MQNGVFRGNSYHLTEVGLQRDLQQTFVDLHDGRLKMLEMIMKAGALEFALSMDAALVTSKARLKGTEQVLTPFLLQPCCLGESSELLRVMILVALFGFGDDDRDQLKLHLVPAISKLFSPLQAPVPHPAAAAVAAAGGGGGAAGAAVAAGHQNPGTDAEAHHEKESDARSFRAPFPFRTVNLVVPTEFFEQADKAAGIAATAVKDDASGTTQLTLPYRVSRSSDLNVTLRKEIQQKGDAGNKSSSISWSLMAVSSISVSEDGRTLTADLVRGCRSIKTRDRAARDTKGKYKSTETCPLTNEASYKATRLIFTVAAGESVTSLVRESKKASAHFAECADAEAPDLPAVEHDPVKYHATVSKYAEDDAITGDDAALEALPQSSQRFSGNPKRVVAADRNIVEGFRRFLTESE
eukprot:g4200.t1